MLKSFRLVSQQLAIVIAVFILAPGSVHAEEQPKKKSALLPETYQLYKDKYPLISFFDLKTAMEDEIVTLIDANKAETYRTNHIPGALSLPALIAGTSKPPQNKNGLLVVYCGGPQCSAWMKAADFASKQGYKNIRHFSGGLKEWRANNEKLETGL